jgi:hypothetical protein
MRQSSACKPGESIDHLDDEAARLAAEAGVRDGAPVVGATPVALTAGDWF